MTVTHRLLESHFSGTPRDGHSSEYRTRANRSLGRNVAFSSKHVLYQRSDSGTVPTVGQQYCTNGRTAVLYQRSDSSTVPTVGQQYCTNGRTAVLYQRSDSSTHSDIAETPVGSGAAGSKLRQSSSFYRSTRRPGPRRQTQVYVTLAALTKHSAPQAGRRSSASLHAPSCCSFFRNTSRSADRIFMKFDTEGYHKNL